MGDVLDTMSREELAAEWRRLNEELGCCHPDDYDPLFEARCRVEDEQERRRQGR